MFYVIFFVGNAFTPGFYSNIVKILRRIEETRAVFKGVPNEVIQNARVVTEFSLKHVNAKRHAGDLCVTIPEFEIQASNNEGVTVQKVTTYIFSFHI